MRHAFREESHAVILPRLLCCRGSPRTRSTAATPTPCSQGKLTARFPHPASRETKRVPRLPPSRNATVKCWVMTVRRAVIGLRPTRSAPRFTHRAKRDGEDQMATLGGDRWLSCFHSLG